MRIVSVIGLVTLLMNGAALADSVKGDMAYIEGDYGVAYREWSTAAASGDASALSAIGTLYDTGHGVPQNFATALEWYRRGAEAGSVRAMFNVGAMYDNGRGTAVDRAASVRWYTMAAERGHGRAAFALGLIFRSGDGVPRNRDAAVRYFRVAAVAGIPAARTNLAQLERRAAPPATAEMAVLVPRPAAPRTGMAAPDAAGGSDAVQKAVLARAPLDAKAVGVFAGLVWSMADQAAGEGRLAQYYLGYAFEHGHGVRRDPVRSYVYYVRASSSGEAAIKGAAMRGAREVGRGLSAAEQSEARDMLMDGSR